MRILFVTSELHPLIKTGGLADVSAALPAALADLGVEVQVVLPGYSEVLDRAVPAGPPVLLGDLPGAGTVRLLAARSPRSNVPLWLVDCPSLYRRAGGPYQDPDGCDWIDNDVRFATLSHAAARMCRGDAAPTWQPDVVHVNDWHAGLVPLLLHDGRESRPATLLTIHNLAFQGLFDADRLSRLGLSAASFSPDGIEFHGRISFLKAGIRHADRLTTVSHTYAREILTPELGCGLDGLLRERAEHLVGIPNGVDYGTWDPSHDPTLSCRYSITDIAGKGICRQALRSELGLDVRLETPVVAVLSRLTEQKMADVIADAVPWLVDAGALLVVHGEGERALERRFLELAGRYSGRVSARIGYDEGLAHRVLAGADILLHPSRFEPFGLVPLYAMRYGTVPVVRRVGGLADTVVDGAVAGDGEATGFAFGGATLDDLIACLRQALDTFRQPVSWRRLQRNAMRRDFGWQEPAKQYLALYQALVGSQLDALPAERARRVLPRPWPDDTISERAGLWRRQSMGG
ncbi:glycogen synthase GlgA [Elioraea tepidiphila]|jgi:starch synthase|uniref:glycogen synthase GlgA n=1 Tax=Elioraea tepidiphila TaxID=457934 RepID=UPI002FDA6828